MLADIVLPSRRFQVFTYHIPHPLQAQVFVGSPVLIPLGSSVVSGVIVRLLTDSDLPSVRSQNPTLTFRDILSLDSSPNHSPLDQRLLTLVEQISEYYLAPLSSCLRLIVPPRVFKATKRFHLTQTGREALTGASLPVESQSVLEKLSRGPNGVLRSSLLRMLPKAATVVTKLKRKGWIEERTTFPAQDKANKQRGIPSRPVSKNTSASSVMGDLFEQGVSQPTRIPSPRRTLSETLKNIADELVKKSISKKFQKQPVVGTDHERQQIFQHVVISLFRQGRRVLILVPEVHQVEMLVRQFREIRSEPVEGYHGHLPTFERAECWERIRSGHVQLVVGTRSALFVPLSDLGLIWVDQEEDVSYKDEHLPYYHARDVASMRGSIEQALVVYGSSYPSLETYAEFSGKFHGNFQFAHTQSLAINLIDMRDHYSGALLAASLADRLTQVLHEGHQAIFILNRKGFSSSLICRDCGQASACKTCGVTLRLFQRPSRLLCQYCGKSFPTPETCPSCMGTVFRFSGVGTQRLEEELAVSFPSHGVFRFDRDQVKTAEAAEEVLSSFRRGDIHILIGTEFLLHQPHPPMASLIAFPQADHGLHHPDFRSAERTFLLFSKALRLVQGKTPIDGASREVFLQTRMPDHHVFQAMATQDPHLFYQEELDLREALAYPPTTHILLLVVTGEQEVRVQRVVEFLDQHMKEVGLHGVLPQEGHGKLEMPMVLGPMSSRKAGRLKKNRTIFLLKTFNLGETQRRLEKIQQAYDQQFGKEPVVLEVHVDPIEIR